MKQDVFGEYGLVRDTEHLKNLITKYKTVKFSVEIDFVVIFKRASLHVVKRFVEKLYTAYQIHYRKKVFARDVCKTNKYFTVNLYVNYYLLV